MRGVLNYKIHILHFLIKVFDVFLFFVNRLNKEQEYIKNSFLSKSGEYEFCNLNPSYIHIHIGAIFYSIISNMKIILALI